VTYQTADAFRMALERRLLKVSEDTGMGLDRLRRRVLFERIVSRLVRADPGRWVLKGGMALEVRLGDEARLSRDIDLGLRDQVANAADLRERLVEALTSDPDHDGFVITCGLATPLREDGGGYLSWRVPVAASLAGKQFGGVKLDVSPRAHELDVTDRMLMPNSLAFAGIPATECEIVDINRHAAEKFHGMLRDYGDRENTRLRDFVDLVILIEHGLLDVSVLAASVRRVWMERDGIEPLTEFPQLPLSWPDRYRRFVAELDLQAQSFPEAVELVARLWAAVR
jgi:Nucleotidyl transferase AbiEii toxin, Type IV TA system